MGKRFVFREYSSSTLTRKIKKFHNKLGNTNTRSIVEVYKIQFQRSPVQQKKPMESYFSQSQQQQISEEIQEMLKKGAVHKIIQNSSSNLGFLINLFLVDKKD